MHIALPQRNTKQNKMSSVRDRDPINNIGGTLFFGLTAGYCLYRYMFPKLQWIDGVPIQEPNSIIGYTDFTNEKAAKRLLREKGPLVQYQVLGRQILQIADKELARLALRDVTGKGFFYNPTPDLVPSSIFSMDTNSEWTRRRSTFRKAFSHSSLKSQLPIVKAMNEKLCSHLKKCADKKITAAVDEIFTHFTIGIICQLAFDMDIDVFDKDFSYAEDIVTKIDNVFKVSNCYLLVAIVLICNVCSLVGSDVYHLHHICTTCQFRHICITRRQEESTKIP
jgi:hypothetical protein